MPGTDRLPDERFLVSSSSCSIEGLDELLLPEGRPGSGLGQVLEAEFQRYPNT